MGESTNAAIPQAFLYRIDGSRNTFLLTQKPVDIQRMPTARDLGK